MGGCRRAPRPEGVDIGAAACGQCGRAGLGPRLCGDELPAHQLQIQLHHSGQWGGSCAPTQQVVGIGGGVTGHRIDHGGRLDVAGETGIGAGNRGGGQGRQAANGADISA